MGAALGSAGGLALSVTGAVLAMLTTEGSSLAARSARLGGIGGLACAALMQMALTVRQVAARRSGRGRFMNKLCVCSGWLARVAIG